ncbi:MAG: phosphopantetheine-binding protein [Candidatus Omnitrophota bacterium]|nr:acyl carrier protein [Candidatus Omnitrophota bacterium]
MDSGISTWLIRWFENNAGMSGQDIENNIDTNYFEKGWIDSFKFIAFIMDIENNFGIRFSNDEFQDKGFSTIKGLAGIIRERIDGR